MKSLIIEAKVSLGGDVLTAISSCVDIAKAYGDNISLTIRDDISILVHKDSNPLDLFEIANLKAAVIKK